MYVLYWMSFVFNPQLGFGKSMATNCIWLDNLTTNTTESYLVRFFNMRYGPISRISLDKQTGTALIFFYNIEHAQKAMQDMKNTRISGRRPKVCSDETKVNKYSPRRQK